MLPFMTQPAVAPACYVPRPGVPAQSQMLKGAQYLVRTPSAPGNRRVWTFAGWVSRAAFGALQYLMFNRVVPVATPDLQTMLQFDGGDSLTFNCQNNGTYDMRLTTSALFRDSAWLHIHAVLETSQDTASERARLTVNGRRIAAFSAQVNPDWNYQSATNSTVPHRIGVGHASMGNLQFWLPALLADLFMVDGLALPETVFGEFNIHGVWVPKPKAEVHAAIAAAGGFGTNGFHLDFSDPLNPGKDVSGKGNHFTAAGFDAAGKDVVASSPTNVYAALSPLAAVGMGVSSALLRDGNLSVDWAHGTSVTKLFGLTIPPQQDSYFEITPTNQSITGSGTTAYCQFSLNGDVVELLNQGSALVIAHNGSVVSSTSPSSQNGQVIRVALHGTGTVDFYVNETLRYSSTLLSGLPKSVFIGAGTQSSGTITVNFGQRAWAYAPPTGFGVICTNNMVEPAIKDPTEAYTDATATGANMVAVLDAGTAHWTGQWVEIVKRRDGAEDWRVRFSDDPGNAMATNSSAGKAAAPALASSGNYWGCRLRIGGKFGVASAEIAHVAGTPTTVTHGLGKSRNSVILKFAGQVGGDWRWWHPDMVPGQLATLNGGGAAVADGTITAVGANSFQIAATAPSGTYRWLVIAEGAGHICLTSHIGSGAAGEAGAFVPSTVCPELFIARRVSLSGDTMVVPATMNPVNPATQLLVTNLPMGETSYRPADLVVGGVKLRGGSPDAYHNTSGAEYVSIQIGRPVGGVCVAPATAR